MSENIEKALIGSILLKPELLGKAKSYGLDDLVFNSPIVKMIWLEMESGEKSGLVPTYPFLLDKNIDGFFLNECMDMAFLEQFDTYCQVLLKNRTDILVQRALENGNYDGIKTALGRFETTFSEQESEDTLTIAQDVVEELLKEPEGGHMTTPWNSLNNALYGLQRGYLIFFGGRPGHHKSNICTNITTHLVKTGKRGLVCDFEMGPHIIFKRMVAVYTETFTSRLLSKRDEVGTLLDEESLQDLVLACDKFTEMIGDKLDIVSYPRLSDIEDRVKDGDYDFLVIDHIQAFAHSEPMENGATMASHVSRICGALKRIARKYDVCILSASQINRDVNGPPRKNHFKESGGIEEYGDVLVGIWWPHAEGNSVNSLDLRCDIHDLEIEIAKNRGGPQGRIELSVNPLTGKIVEKPASKYLSGNSY